MAESRDFFFPEFPALPNGTTIDLGGAAFADLTNTTGFTKGDCGSLLGNLKSID